MPILGAVSAQSSTKVQRKIWILSVAIASSLCLTLNGSYLLIFESDGKEHLVEGIEESKPYYFDNGEKQFLHHAGKIKVNPGPDANDSDFFYPISYTIEKIAQEPDQTEERLRYRLEINVRNHRSGEKRNFDPDKLLALWQQEEIADGILGLVWISEENIQVIDITRLVAIEKPDLVYNDLEGTVLDKIPEGYPALSLFIAGESIPPRQPVQDPQLLSSVLAACRGSVETINENAESERVRDFRDEEGNSVLHFAASNGHANIVKILLESGLNPNQRNGQGATPLIVAAEHGRSEVVEQLLAVRLKIDATDTHNGTALHYAIRFGHEDIVLRLLDSGCNKHIRGFDGYSPVSLALNNNRGRTVEKLADLKSRWNTDRESVDRLLVSKCAQGQNRIVRYLVSKGGRADRLLRGTTAFVAAMRYADEEMLITLLEARADVKQTNEKEISPLMAASYWDNVEAVEWLLKHGADVDYTTDSGTSAISVAARYHHSGVVRILLSYGADPNLANREGFTPLETATLHGDRSIVRDLIKAGAECDLTEEKALLLMDYAFRNNIPEFVEIALNECLMRDFQFYDRFPSNWVAHYYDRDEILALLSDGTARGKEIRNNGPTVLPASQLEEKPALITAYNPRYPEELAAKFGDRLIRVRFLVGEDGSVLFPKLVSGDVPVLNQIALNTVRRWKFRPPLASGRPVLTEVQVPINFKRLDPEKFVMELRELDQAPRRIYAARPVYPFYLKESGVQGSVNLEIVIDSTGSVISAHAVSSTHPDFDQSAIDAIFKWKFEPGYKNGLPVKTRRIQPISFRLN